MLKTHILILNYNGIDILPRCLPSVVEAARKASYPTGVTLLDNGSTDRSVEWTRQRYPEVRIDRAKQNRFLVSFNEGVENTEVDIVILMNSDLRVDPGFVDPLVRVFKKHPDAFLASPQSFTFDGSRYEGGITHAQVRWGIFWASASFPGSETVRQHPGYTFASGFGAFHRKRFLALGGYDDLYLPGIMEDADLGFRAWRAGYRSYYAPESRVYHMGQASFSKAFGKKGILTMAHRHTFLLMWKNLSDAGLLFQHFLFLIPRLVFASLRGQTEFTAGFFQALGRLPEAQKRRRFPKKRSRSDPEIFRLANGESEKKPYLFKKKWMRFLMGIFDGIGFFGMRWLRRSERPSRYDENYQRILVLRIDSLGDGVLTLPAIQALHQRFPKAQIDFLVSAPIFDLYQHLFPASEVHLFQKSWLTGRGSFKEIFSESRSVIRKLRLHPYDLGIDFRGDFRTIFLMTAAGIHERWGRGGTGAGFLLTHQTKNPYTKHELLENLDLVSEAAMAWPSFPISSQVEGKIAGWLNPLNPQNKIVIHLGAGYPSKRWPASRFAELVRLLGENRLGVPIFIGTRTEKKILDTFRGELVHDFLDLTEKTSLVELAALLKHADLFVGNDSGPAHLAAMLGCQTILIFSGTNDFRRWAPWTPKLRILHRPVPCSPCEEETCPLEKQICLEEISTQEVFEALEEALLPLSVRGNPSWI